MLIILCEIHHSLHNFFKSFEMNCDPWSEINVFGLPNRQNTSSSKQFTILRAVAVFNANNSTHFESSQTATSKNWLRLPPELSGKGPIKSIARVSKTLV